jgi:mercuric ion transport protein
MDGAHARRRALLDGLKDSERGVSGLGGSMRVPFAKHRYPFEAKVSDGKILKVGLIGAVVAAICCFTPALVVLLGVLGLSHLAGLLDYVLLPALLVFVGLIVYALIRKSRAAAQRAESR